MKNHFDHARKRTTGAALSRAFGVLVCLIAILLVAASEPAPSISIPNETRLIVGRTQVLPFTLAAPAKGDTTLPCTINNPAVIRIITPAEVLDGQTLGFVRVEALKVGDAMIEIGHQKRALHVVPAVVTPMVDAWPVRLTGPARGACVWGKITVGIDVGIPDRVGDQKITALELVVNNKTVSRREISAQLVPPTFHGVIELDADALKPGPIGVTARALLSNGRSLSSEPFPLLVERIKPESLQTGECEDTLSNLFENKENAKPSIVGSDADASGGKMVACYSSEPMWGFEADVHESGMYQLMIVARGEIAAGTYPSIGVKTKPGNESESASSLVDYRWHRIPAGRPFAIAAGKQRIGVNFLNDFFAAGYADRNLFLDRWELARIDSLGGSPAQPAASSSMMSGESSNTMMAAKPAASGDTMMMSSMTSKSSAAALPGAGQMMMAMMAGGAAVDGSGSIATFDAKRWLADANAMPPLIVAFVDTYDGLEIDGDQLITGFTRISTPETTPAPRVDLLINGKVALSEVGPAPRFRVDPAYFKAGDNTLQLLAVSANGAAQTQVHHVTVAPQIVTGAKPLRHVYLHVSDDAVWSENVKPVRKDGWPKGHEIAVFNANVKTTVTLPADLEGEYEVRLDSRSEGSKRATAKLFLKTAEGEKEFGHVDPPTWLEEHVVAKVTLPPGPKQVVIAFDNALNDAGKPDKKLYIRALVLRELFAKDLTPPVAELLHPRDGQTLWNSDVAVIRAADDQKLNFVDVVIDGARQGTQADFYSHRGNAILPLAIGRLAPGEHTLCVRAADEAGNIGSSKTIRFYVTATQPQEPTEYHTAIALLNRFAFGAETRELADVLTMGPEAWLRNRLDRLATSPGELEALARASSYYPDPYDSYQVTQRSLMQAIRSDNPVRARFVFWLNNHFTTWIHKVDAQRKWEEYISLFAIGPARFDELLLTSATSPSMLRYLDQSTSFETKLNENYAREIMELHSVGVHGGYTQADVTTLAHVLNGWMGNDEVPAGGRGFPLASRFYFDPTLNAGKAAKWFGVNLPQAAPNERYDRVRRVIETLAAHPSTADFICKKLVEHYGSYPASPALVKRLATTFLATGGDLREVLVAMSNDKEFRSQMFQPRVATPMDYSLRLSRITNLDGPGNVYEYMARSGMSLFNRITPDGYPQSDESYSDSNAMLQRWKLAGEIEWNLYLIAPRSLAWGKPVDPDLWRQQVVDAYAIRLTGKLLSPASNQAAMELLNKSTASDGEMRMRQVAALIASFPESSTR